LFHIHSLWLAAIVPKGKRFLRSLPNSLTTLELKFTHLKRI
jgi:hypothetical protein